MVEYEKLEKRERRKMLRIFAYCACVFLIAVLFFIISIIYCNECILRNTSKNFFLTIVCLFNPPSDLFEQKGRVELYSGKSLSKLKLKYYGPYVVEFVPKNTLGKNVFLDGVECRARFSILMLVNDKIVFEKKVDGKQLSGWSSASESGFTICRFDVPEDIPPKQEILMEVVVDAGDDVLAQAGWIFVARTSSL